MFAAGRNLFNRATGRQPSVPQEPSLVDHIKRSASETGRAFYDWVGQRSPWSQQRLDEIIAGLSDLERNGVMRHFDAFNSALIRPLSGEGAAHVAEGLRQSARCTPGQNPASALGLWIPLSVWMNVAFLFVNLALPGGFDLAEVIGLGFAYLGAYYLHVIMLVMQRPHWMAAALIVCGFYITLQMFSGLMGLIFLVPAVMAFMRAVVMAIVLFYGFQLWRVQEENEEQGGVAASIFRGDMFRGTTGAGGHSSARWHHRGADML
jgi:hypothetical protein